MMCFHYAFRYFPCLSLIARTFSTNIKRTPSTESVLKTLNYLLKYQFPPGIQSENDKLLHHNCVKLNHTINLQFQGVQMMTVAEKIKHLRTTTGITQGELAKLLDVEASSAIVSN